MIICLREKWIRTTPWIIGFVFGIVILSYGSWMAVHGTNSEHQNTVKILAYVSITFAGIILTFPLIHKVIDEIRKANRIKAASLVFHWIYSWTVIVLSIILLVNVSSFETYKTFQDNITTCGFIYLGLGILLVIISTIPIGILIREQF